MADFTTYAVNIYVFTGSKHFLSCLVLGSKKCIKYLEWCFFNSHVTSDDPLELITSNNTQLTLVLYLIGFVYIDVMIK